MSIQITYKEEPTQNIRRGPWSPEEDRKLLDAIHLYGPSNWVRISQSLGSRTPKQCRERYHQNLKPSLNRNPISAEEGQLIEELVLKYGKRWAEIARHLNGRSDNAIKNWWNGGANRRRRASSHAVLQEMRDVQQLAQGYPPPPPHQQVYQPTFNTSIFEGGFPPQTQTQAQAQGTRVPMMGQQQQQQQQQALQQALQQHQQSLGPQMLPPISRSSSITQEMFLSQPGVKRLLEDHHNPPVRRHSAQTILVSTTGSSPYSRAGSSRNSSISEHNNNNLSITSSATSRRSSLAHELFPNPMAKRQGSYSSTYLSPSLNTTYGGPLPGLAPLTPISSHTVGQVPSQMHHNTVQLPPQQNSQGGHATTAAPTQQQYGALPHIQSQMQSEGVFKKGFSFDDNAAIKGQQTLQSVKLPPPSMIAGNSNFETAGPVLDSVASSTVDQIKPRSVDNDLITNGDDDNDNDGDDDEKQENVMNISNLLD